MDIYIYIYIRKFTYRYICIMPMQHSTRQTAQHMQLSIWYRATPPAAWLLCCCDAMFLDCKNINAYRRYSARETCNHWFSTCIFNNTICRIRGQMN